MGETARRRLLGLFSCNHGSNASQRLDHGGGRAGGRDQIVAGSLVERGRWPLNAEETFQRCTQPLWRVLQVPWSPRRHRNAETVEKGTGHSGLRNLKGGVVVAACVPLVELGTDPRDIHETYALSFGPVTRELRPVCRHGTEKRV